jgi:hypothetical protein
MMIYISISQDYLGIMSGELLYDIIKIEPSIFKDYYNKLNKNELNPFLSKKKAEIYTSICFHTTYESYYHADKDDEQNGTRFNSHSYNGNKYAYKHKYTSYKKPNPHTNRANHSLHDTNSIHDSNCHGSQSTHRLYILNTNFTEESKIKKQFTSYLNKLTNQNAELIYSKIEEILKEPKQFLYDIVWDFIKKSPEELYIRILKFFDTQITDEKYEQYVVNKEWLPADDILNNNPLKHDETKYDVYCDYVKWKKEITNINKAWCLMFQETHGKHKCMIEDIYNVFDKYKESKNHKHVVDFSLEQIFIFFKYSKYKSNNIINKLKQFDKKIFESSTKFLVMNIIEM